MRYAAITDRLYELGGDKWAVHNAARAHQAKGKEVIELSIGEPDITTDPALVEHCINALRAGRTRYSNGRGEPGLVDALIDTSPSFYQRRERAVFSRHPNCIVRCHSGTGR